LVVTVNPAVLLLLAVVAVVLLGSSSSSSGGGGLGAILGGGYDASKIRTGVAAIDRLPLASNISKVWGPTCPVGVARAVTAIVWMESRGDPSQYLSDTGDSRGPSIGPMNVLRQTAIQMGFVPAGTSFATYSDFVNTLSEDTLVNWGCREFAQDLIDQGGDIGAALREYNGSQRYATEAVTWLQKTYGDDWEGGGTGLTGSVSSGTTPTASANYDDGSVDYASNNMSSNDWEV
jgi:hypothetical protein